MLEQRNPKRDVFALALLAVCVFLTLALVTYHPADPPGRAAYPPANAVHNACGKMGAYTADYLYRGMGLGAYFLLGTLVVVDLLLLARREISEPWLRAIGWSLALAGISTLAALISPEWRGPVIGPGGYLGASGRGWLETHFASVGSYVLTVSMILAGLLLCTDYILVRVAGWLFGPPMKGITAVGKRAISATNKLAGKRAAPLASDLETARGELTAATNTIEKKLKAGAKAAAAKLAAVDDLDDDDDDEAESPFAIKIRGKKFGKGATSEESDDDDEANADDSDDDSLANKEAADPGDDPANAKTKALAANASSGKSGANNANQNNPNLRIKNLKKDDRAAVIQELEAASRQADVHEYELPPIDLLVPNEAVYKEEHEKEIRTKAKQIEKTFADFGFNVKVVEIETGPVIAQYEVELEAGLRLSKITGLADDLAIALRVPSVRIVAPIPGKNTVGIEVPNSERQLVSLREVIEETNGKAKKMKIPIFLGKDVAGNPMTVDLTTLPHLLIAGRTGTGKSVCLNSIIVSMLMTRKPDEVKMLMIDPKMVELSPYKTLPHLMHPVVTDMRKAEAILAWAVEKMEERYALLARAGVRHISVFNQLGAEELRDRLRPENDEEWASIPRTLPFIVIIADEMADLMMTSGKEVEQHIIRLAQKSRAVGIHLIMATQKPTVDVITGLIKSNLPARIAFQVASRTDSRVVLDEMGADKLLGNGDMLFLWPGTSALLRGQGTYVSDDEITRVVNFVGTSEPEFVKELVQLKAKDQQGGDPRERIKSRDELYESAVEVVIREGRGSVSLLQRALGIGYGRAARMVDYMAEDGIVGEYNGSNAREVLMTIEQWNELMGNVDEPVTPVPAAPPPTKKNRILPERNNDHDSGGGPNGNSDNEPHHGGNHGNGNEGNAALKPHLPLGPTGLPPRTTAPLARTAATIANAAPTATLLKPQKKNLRIARQEEDYAEEFTTEDESDELNQFDAEETESNVLAPWEKDPEVVTREWQQGPRSGVGNHAATYIDDDDELDNGELDDEPAEAADANADGSDEDFDDHPARLSFTAGNRLPLRGRRADHHKTGAEDANWDEHEIDFVEQQDDLDEETEDGLNDEDDTIGDEDHTDDEQ